MEHSVLNCLMLFCHDWELSLLSHSDISCYSLFYSVSYIVYLTLLCLLLWFVLHFYSVPFMHCIYCFLLVFVCFAFFCFVIFLYCAVPCRAVCRVVLCAVLYAVPCRAVPCRAVPCRVQCCAVQCSAVQCCAVLCCSTFALLCIELRYIIPDISLVELCRNMLQPHYLTWPKSLHSSLLSGERGSCLISGYAIIPISAMKEVVNIVQVFFSILVIVSMRLVVHQCNCSLSP